MLRRRWCLLLRLRWHRGVHWIILIIDAKWTSHRRINSTSHARNTAHWRRLFGWRHLQTHESLQNCEFHTVIIYHQLTSRPMLPLSENLIGFEWLLACINVVKWLMPISSRDDFRLPVCWPKFGRPWRSEFERRSRISPLSICLENE